MLHSRGLVVYGSYSSNLAIVLTDNRTVQICQIWSLAIIRSSVNINHFYMAPDTWRAKNRHHDNLKVHIWHGVHRHMVITNEQCTKTYWPIPTWDRLVAWYGTRIRLFIRCKTMSPPRPPVSNWWLLLFPGRWNLDSCLNHSMTKCFADLMSQLAETGSRVLCSTWDHSLMRCLAHHCKKQVTQQ